MNDQATENSSTHADQSADEPRPSLLAGSLETLRRLERFSVSALPARTSWVLPGWICLADDGGFVGRVNSATPVPHDEPVGVSEVAASYQARNLPPLIRWTPEAPDETAEQLRESGWQSRGEVLVMTRQLSPDDADAGHEVELGEEASDDWQSTYESAFEATEGASRLRLALAAPDVKRFAEMRIEGVIAGVGLGLNMDGALGVFDVLTAPEFRRQGVARQIVRALLAWGLSRGADLAFLQVAASNEAAVQLYEQLGFAVAYTYVYAEPEPA